MVIHLRDLLREFCVIQRVYMNTALSLTQLASDLCLCVLTIEASMQ